MTKRSHTFKYETGRVYGRLRVVGIAGFNAKKNALWKCICECGREKSVRGNHLRRGFVKSCGCFQVDNPSTPEYIAWCGMKARCGNPADPSYKNYGGSGIIVSPQWSDSFETFLRNVWRRPSSKHSIDRYPNNDGNYEPGNVRWATRKEQCRNRRTNVKIEIGGVVKTMTEWAEMFGISNDTAGARIKNGWDAITAVTRPIRKR